MTDLWDSEPGKGGAGFAAEGAEIQEGGQPCGLTEPQRARRRPPIDTDGHSAAKPQPN